MESCNFKKDFRVSLIQKLRFEQNLEGKGGSHGGIVRIRAFKAEKIVQRT